MKALLLVAALVSPVLALAPMQCGSDQSADLRYEDSPAEALWDLSERFEQAGESAGRTRTLEFIVSRYPSSRFAERSRQVLGAGDSAGGQGAGTDPAGTDPAMASE